MSHADSVLLAGGFPPATVCEWALAEGPDLLVAGGYRGRIERALRGGFAEHLLHNAPCTVLIVRPRGKPRGA